MGPEVAAGAILAVAAVILGLVVIWIRWSLRTAVRESVLETVNGKIDRLYNEVTQVKGTVETVNRWTYKHDRRHKHEQQQLIAALRRQGFEAPDGWIEDRKGS